jgi:hypothetical protein
MKWMAAMLLATACGGGAPDQGCAPTWWFSHGAEDGPSLACAGADGTTGVGGDRSDSCDSCWSGHDGVVEDAGAVWVIPGAKP